MINKNKKIILGILLVLVCFSLVSAASAEKREWSFQTKNIQEYSPGSYSSYTKQNAQTYWPNMFNPENCGEGASDFIMNIRPGSCTPQVVRSDLLEEQNVPVFCKVDVIKVNPLIDVEDLKSVKYKGELPPEVAGVSFHPNREAFYSNKLYIDNPILNDAGYVVIVLKRIPKEEDMPDFVRGNITGVLSYNAEHIFGTGDSNFYLKTDQDPEENSFFKGRGYLSADWIDDESAGISIYSGEEKYASFELQKGETSDLVYMPGFYCRGGIQVRLEDITAGVKRVKLEIDGEEKWLIQGEKFLDEQCIVRSILISERKGKIRKSARIYCRGMGTRTLYYDSQCIDNDDCEELYNSGYVCISESCVKEEESGEKTGTDSLSSLEDDVKENYIKAESISNNLIEYYGSVESNEEIWSAKALYQLGLLSRDLNLNNKAEEIFKKVIEEYSGSGYAKQAELKLGTLYKEGDVQTKSGHTDIRLLQIIQPSRAEASADFKIKGKSWNFDNYPIQNLQEKDQDEDFIITLKKLYHNKVDIVCHESRYETTRKAGAALQELMRTDATLELGEVVECGDYEVRLENINYTANAVVSLNPKMPGDYSEADFTFQIGIEKRDIKLSPEKTQEMIDNLNESIAEWEDRVESLGSLVEGMKGACLVTSSVLLVKNFFSNLGGAGMARQEVMDAWEDKAKRELGPNAGRIEINNYLREHSPDIESDIQKIAQGYEKFNQETIALQQASMKNDVVQRKKVVEEISGKMLDENGRSAQEVIEEGLNVKEDWVVDIQNKEKIDGAIDYAEYYIKDVAKTDAERNKAEAALSVLNQYESNLENEKEIPSKVLTFKYPDVDADGEPITKTGVLTQEGLENAGIRQINDLRMAQWLEEQGASDAAIRQFGERSLSISKSIDKKARTFEGGLLSKEKESSNTWVLNLKAKYFRSGENKGLTSVVPIPGYYTTESKEDKKQEQVTGFYVYINELEIGKGSRYTKAGGLNSFWIQNVGGDGRLDLNDDVKFLKTTSYDGEKILGLTAESSKKLVRDAEQAIYIANRNYGKDEFYLDGERIIIDKVSDIGGTRCTDFMSPQDCHLLFNICDPVMCPASRCDLGGTFRVDDVVQSGIIGSIALCLPNAREGIVIPVCISGIYAGLDSYVQILKAHRDCLQESLANGRMVGICDQIYSIYLCEFFWRQIAPFLDSLIPRLIGLAYGQGMKGGGEYLTVQNAWNTAKASIDWMRDHYAVNAYKAFNARSTADIGTEICNVFVSARYPNDEGFFDNLLKADSPEQYHAWFDEIPYSDATHPPTSQYKVFYLIYAGKDQGVNFQVYLKDPTEYAYTSTQGVYIVDTGFIPAGGTGTKSRDFTAPSGYQKLCVRINEKETCGFKRVSTSFALNYITDKYYEEQLRATDITTEEECRSGKSSLLGLTQTGNLQEGVSGSLNPELEKKGITRICSNSNPGGEGDDNWVDVGFCDTEDVRCWLDKRDIEDVLTSTEIEKKVTKAVESGGSVSKILEETHIIKEKDADERLTKIREVLKKIEKELDDEDNLNYKFSLVFDLVDSVESGKTVEKIGSMKEVMEGIDFVKERAPYNAQKAEAVYYKFRFYYLVTRARQDYHIFLNEERDDWKKSENEREEAKQALLGEEAPPLGLDEETLLKYYEYEEIEKLRSDKYYLAEEIQKWIDGEYGEEDKDLMIGILQDIYYNLFGEMKDYEFYYLETDYGDSEFGISIFGEELPYYLEYDGGIEGTIKNIEGRTIAYFEVENEDSGGPIQFVYSDGTRILDKDLMQWYADNFNNEYYELLLRYLIGGSVYYYGDFELVPGSLSERDPGEILSDLDTSASEQQVRESWEDSDLQRGIDISTQYSGVPGKKYTYRYDDQRWITNNDDFSISLSYVNGVIQIAKLSSSVEINEKTITLEGKTEQEFAEAILETLRDIKRETTVEEVVEEE